MRARTLATACPVSVSWIKIASTILKSSKTYLPESVTKYVIFPQNCHHLAHIELAILNTDSNSAHFCRRVCRVQNVMKGGGHRERNRKEFFSKLLPHQPTPTWLQLKPQHDPGDPYLIVLYHLQRTRDNEAEAVNALPGVVKKIPGGAEQQPVRQILYIISMIKNFKNWTNAMMR